MNKYFNKGLLYAWFNSAKAAMFLGIFAWGFFANRIIKGNLFSLSNEISSSFSNYYYTTQLYEYFVLGVIFIAIYYIAKGTNKRNIEMFLSSGPYTKKQIKYNELLCLLITLVLFVIVYIYIAFMAYINQRELISIIEGYTSITIIEIIRIILIGIIGIVFMLIIDSMFSNSTIGLISMFSVIPFSIFIIFMKIYEILNYCGLWYNWSLLCERLNGYNTNDEFNRYYRSFLLDRVQIYDITIKCFSAEIIISVIVILIMFVIYNLIQRRVKLENYNKIFSSRANECILVSLVSIAIGSFGSLLLLEGFIRRMQNKNPGFAILNGMDLVKGLGADILCIVIIGSIMYKIIKKILKNIV